MRDNSDPQYTAIWNSDSRQILIAERRLCGQASGRPMAVELQSKRRISAPISPPPLKKSSEVGVCCPRSFLVWIAIGAEENSARSGGSLINALLVAMQL